MYRPIALATILVVLLEFYLLVLTVTSDKGLIKQLTKIQVGPVYHTSHWECKWFGSACVRLNRATIGLGLAITSSADPLGVSAPTIWMYDCE